MWAKMFKEGVTCCACWKNSEGKKKKKKKEIKYETERETYVLKLASWLSSQCIS